MVKKKPQSKRRSLHDKYKIAKRVREKHRKDNKLAKQNAHKRQKKDPGIPNNWPFKEQMLNLMQQKKEKMEEEKRRLRERQRSQKDRAAEQAIKAEIERSAGNDRHEAFRLRIREGIISKESLLGNGRRPFFREFHKLIDASDVIIELLDARDPIGYRCPEVEKYILAKENKKIVLVLNKVDLVPREVVQQWLAYLRREFPTVPFKCNSNRRATDASTSDSMGSDGLIQLLKTYARSADKKNSIAVGVIGFPNAGKSSFINSLVLSRNVITASTQEIPLDPNVGLLGCPGVIFPPVDHLSSAESDPTLRTYVKLPAFDDPLVPVDLLLKRIAKERLLELYALPNFESTQEFLDTFARKQGKLRKGGIPDIPEAARHLLKEWNRGKIPFYCPAPAESTGASAPSWEKDFTVDDAVKRDESLLMAKLTPLASASRHMKLESAGPGRVDPALFEAPSSKDEEEEDEESPKSGKRKASKQLQKDDEEEESDEEEQSEEEASESRQAQDDDAYDFSALGQAEGASDSEEDEEEDGEESDE